VQFALGHARQAGPGGRQLVVDGQCFCRFSRCDEGLSLLPPIATATIHRTVVFTLSPVGL
jgi:hypothetical protein